MAIEGILERIAADARAEAERIAAEAERDAARIREEGSKRCDAIARDAEARARREAEERRKHLEVALEREAARAILAEKQRLIDEVFARARERIEKLDAGAYADLAARILARAASSGDEEIILPEGDDRIGTDLVARVNADLAKAGRKGELRIAEERRRMGSGFILRSGRRETNCTVDAMIEAKREDLEAIVAQVLFGGGGAR